ncbi:hypothetical protein RJ640_023094 [Escallonia rubra]|uniref:Uncharacterized protein n=1 Tax=Escallonia rubra TaxID=112253 RepID=A0AA88S7G1_9ASTE|nr:hypothetical protein RJ640_023094 [Escallonia rubra]
MNSKILGFSSGAADSGSSGSNFNACTTRVMDDILYPWKLIFLSLSYEDLVVLRVRIATSQQKMGANLVGSIADLVVHDLQTRLYNCSGNLVSMLESSKKRKQLTKASCKNSVGKPLVDGVKPVSASMFGTVGLELTKFFNPDLTWKTVTKGQRSTTRRSRKPATRILEESVRQGDKCCKNLEGPSDFESEKLGVAVLGQHFAEKVIHVPIKKRRFLPRSPSPPPRTPQTPSPHPEELVDGKCASGQPCCSDSFSNRQTSSGEFGHGVDEKVMNGTISKVTHQALCYSEDFSGIELLAAAACSSSIDDNGDSDKEASVVKEFATPEGIDISTAAKPMENTIASPVTCTSLQEELIHGSCIDGLLVQENSDAVSPNLHHGESGKGGCLPPKDERFHWDLNVVMDAWEEPSDNLIAISQGNDSDHVLGNGLQIEKLNTTGCEVQRDYQDTRREDFKLSSGEIPAGNADKDVCKLENSRSKEEISGLIDSRNLSGDVISTLTCKTLEVVDTASKSEQVAPSSTGEGQPVIGHDAEERDGKSTADSTVNGFSFHVNVPSSSSVKCAIKDPIRSHDEGSHMIGVGSMTELQAGYDSPFEDGELREPVLYSWEENEVEDAETEYVDYESDNGYQEDLDAVDYSISEEIQVIDDGLLETKGDNEKNRMVGTKTIPDTLPERKGEKSGHDNMDELDEKSSLAGEVGSRASRGKLTPCKDYARMHHSRSNNLGGSYSRPERELVMRGGRFYYQWRGRNEVCGDRDDSSAGYRDSRNRYPNRGLDGESYSRPRRAIANTDGDITCHNRRQSLSSSSKGMHRPLIRRTSPDDRNDTYGMHRGTPPMRGVSHDRNRGRSGIYSQGFRRGPKEEYLEPVPHVPYYSGRREQGFPPNFRRGGGHFSRPRRKSRSRSRSPSGSPRAWHFQRERNASTRRRSPVFVSDARMEGMRLPFQKPNYAADYGESFMSPSRSRLSPGRTSRWFDDQNSIDNRFRERRSPVRMFRRNQRFDSVGYSERFKSDDYVRPMARRGRFSLMSGAVTGRKHEYSDDDRTKREDRYEVPHRVRRYDAGGIVRRFRYDAEDCFEARSLHDEDDCFRRAVRRDAPRSARQDRGPARMDTDRTCTTAASGGMQDHDKDASPSGE